MISINKKSVADDYSLLEKLMYKFSGSAVMIKKTDEVIELAREDPSIDFIVKINETQLLKQEIYEGAKSTFEYGLGAIDKAVPYIITGLAVLSGKELIDYARSFDTSNLITGLVGLVGATGIPLIGSLLNKFKIKKKKKRLEHLNKELEETIKQAKIFNNGTSSEVIDYLNKNIPEFKDMMKEALDYVEEIKEFKSDLIRFDNDYSSSVKKVESQLKRHLKDISNIDDRISQNEVEMIKMKFDISRLTSTIDVLSSKESSHSIVQINGLKELIDNNNFSMQELVFKLNDVKETSDKQRYVNLKNSIFNLFKKKDPQDYFACFDWFYSDVSYGGLASALIGIVPLGLALSDLTQASGIGNVLCYAGGFLGGCLTPFFLTATIDVLKSPFVFLHNKKRKKYYTYEYEKNEFFKDTNFGDNFVRVINLSGRRVKNKKMRRRAAYSLIEDMKRENFYGPVILDCRECVINKYSGEKKVPDYSFLKISDDPAKVHKWIDISYSQDALLDDFGFKHLEHIANSGIILVNSPDDYYPEINDAVFDQNLAQAIKKAVNYVAEQSEEYLSFLSKKHKSIKMALIKNNECLGESKYKVKQLVSFLKKTGSIFDDLK